MSNIKILDCTLRDGGYVNDWNFGKSNIDIILKKLELARIDIIECGFIKNKSYHDDFSLFNFKDLDRLSLSKKQNIQYVAMINYGDCDIDNIPNQSETSIDGLRVAFHNEDLEGALDFCNSIKEKGYKLFMQPMVSNIYSREEFLKLIEKTNDIKPYAFYIVDSFGSIKKNDLIKLYSWVEGNLSYDISLGYHAHNNLQSAFSNAQLFIELEKNRNIIIDSSIFGMGRGSGNLNTELFIDYLNTTFGYSYKKEPILHAMDDVINNIYKEKQWGYSMPHYLSAVNNCHPNYATYLAEKDTLKINHINIILNQIENNKKNSFNKEYIEKLYGAFQSFHIDDEAHLNDLREKIKGKNIVLLASGHSLLEEKEKLLKHFNGDNIIMSVNFIPKNLECDFVFYSNLKRFEDNTKYFLENLILTSNISRELGNLAKYIINYNSLLNGNDFVNDNSGLMAIKLLIKLGCNKIYMAGFDGYSIDPQKDYIDKSLILRKSKEVVDKLNLNIKEKLDEFSTEVSIEFLTNSKYK